MELKCFGNVLPVAIGHRVQVTEDTSYLYSGNILHKLRSCLATQCSFLSHAECAVAHHVEPMLNVDADVDTDGTDLYGSTSL